MFQENDRARCADWILRPGQEPPLGTHIVTPRCGYTHHGIYVGHGRVVQYAGLAYGLRRGPVEEVVLAQFSRGNPVWVRSGEFRWFDDDEVVRRARSRVGEDRYHLLTNNCEHFCEWCVRGEHRSYQVDEWLCHLRRGLGLVVSLIARLRALSTPRSERVEVSCETLGTVGYESHELT